MINSFSTLRRLKFFIPLLFLTYFSIWNTTVQATTADSFSDVPEKYVYADAISYLKENGIIKGYADGTFKPMDPINRAEFLLIIMKSRGYEGNGKNCFKDVKNEWYSPYVCEAKKLGFVKGYKDGLFRPENGINLAEASTIIVNVFNLEKNVNDNEPWYKPYIVALEKQNAIPLSAFQFDYSITRGHMAEMVWRLMTNNTTKKSLTYERIKQKDDVVEQLYQNQGKPYYDNFIIEGSLQWVSYVLQPYSSINKDLLDQYYFLNEIIAQAAIEEGNISLDSTELVNLEEIDAEIIKEIKAISGFFIGAYISNPDYSTDDNTVFLRIYKNWVYLVVPFKEAYYIYPSLDADTVSFINRSIIDHGVIDHPLFKQIIVTTSEIDQILFIKDKNYIYEIDTENFSLTPLKQLDAKTFKPMASNFDTDPIPSKDVIVFKDKNNIYHLIDKKLYISLDDVDVSSFESHLSGGYVFPQVLYFTDKDNVYFIDANVTNPAKALSLVPNSDPVTFEEIKHGFFKDKNQVYVWFEPIDGADPNTIQIYSYNEYKFLYDDKNVWLYAGELKKLDNADPGMFYDEAYLDSLIEQIQ